MVSSFFSFSSKIKRRAVSTARLTSVRAGGRKTERTERRWEDEIESVGRSTKPVTTRCGVARSGQFGKERQPREVGSWEKMDATSERGRMAEGDERKRGRGRER